MKEMMKILSGKMFFFLSNEINIQQKMKQKIQCKMYMFFNFPRTKNVQAYIGNAKKKKKKKKQTGDAMEGNANRPDQMMHTRSHKKKNKQQINYAQTNHIS